MTLHLQNYIGGRFVTVPARLDSYDPSTAQVGLTVPDSGQPEVDEAVAAAAAAFTSWSKLPVQQRTDFCLKAAAILESRLDEFAAAESRDQGKPVWLAKAVDIPRAVLNFRAYAESVNHQLATSNTPTPGVLNYTLRQPVGVAALISPWNLPLYLLTFKIAPAIMTGNTVVCKPSEFTSLTAFKLAEVLHEIGLPPGVVNIVFGFGPRAGEALVKHPDVKLVSFTGSTVVGKHINELCAPALKKVCLEMGGKNAAVVFADADLREAIPTLTRGAFVNSGQVCLCTSRIFVQKAIYDEFLQLFVKETRSKRVGPPDQEGVFMGPLNNRAQLEKVRRYLQLARDEGGTLLCGEGVDPALQLPQANKQGYFVQPTVITDLKDDSRCMREEIFGPVTCVVPFDSEEEVVERVNSAEYGLCASVWSRDLSTIHRVSEQLQVGTVWNNCWLVRNLDMPFGGIKESGMGFESTRDSVEFYTHWKTVCVKF
ncbi:2-aminomuconic semialdehyde dehydrogenase-like isoform X2 [Pollicipes pollicipes]|nr:2-aminomuconic semialdehyde dehydrogenase-like isoform X2 [Pollicipes pollicipes]XP_037084471.1 2-aminomuconic semialdehyde dehydrogenase-like isoform X2 [Pollicipes pollicipes]XP_037084472.1 2-aminomuconic semialdehyde dehydrogenase-like isoform X2 [Pollicipes pollicipes]